MHVFACLCRGVQTQPVLVLWYVAVSNNTKDVKRCIVQCFLKGKHLLVKPKEKKLTSTYWAGVLWLTFPLLKALSAALNVPYEWHTIITTDLIPLAIASQHIPFTFSTTERSRLLKRGVESDTQSLSSMGTVTATCHKPDFSMTAQYHPSENLGNRVLSKYISLTCAASNSLGVIMSPL